MWDNSGAYDTQLFLPNGAYNNDGTLKENALVLYLTNDNKNTLTATFNGTTYTGIANILSNLLTHIPIHLRTNVIPKKTILYYSGVHPTASATLHVLANIVDTLHRFYALS